MGRSKLYLLINEGHIETIKVGSMTLIPMRSLETFLEAARGRDTQGSTAGGIQGGIRHSPANKD